MPLFWHRRQTCESPACSFESAEASRSGLVACLVVRPGNSPLPVVVSTVCAIAITVVTETEGVRNNPQLLSNVRPVVGNFVVHPTCAGNSIEVLCFLHHPPSFIPAAVKIASIAEARLQITYRISKLTSFIVDTILATRAVSAAAVERAINVSFELSGEPVQTMN